MSTLRMILVLALLAWIVLFGVITTLWGVAIQSLPLAVAGIVFAACGAYLFDRVSKFPKPPIDREDA